MKQKMQRALLLLMALMLACPTVTLSEEAEPTAPVEVSTPVEAVTQAEAEAPAEAAAPAEAEAPAEAAAQTDEMPAPAAEDGAAEAAAAEEATQAPDAQPVEQPEVAEPVPAEDMQLFNAVDEVVQPLSEISVSPLTVGVGQTLPLNASVLPAETALSFATGNKKICTVDAKGNVKGVAAGTAQIVVTAADGRQAECTVTVVKAPSKIVLSQTKHTLGTGDIFQLSYTIPADTSATITWATSNKKVATVDANGLVTAVGAGKATITAKTHNGKKATCKLTVKKSPSWIKAADAEVRLGVGQKLEDAFQWESGTYTQLSCATTNDQVAWAENDGTLIAAGVGEATVTATTHNGHSAQMLVRVYPAPESVALPSENLVMGVKQTGSLAAILPEGTMVGLTYASSNKKVVSVDAAGNIKALRTGTATIKVTTHNGKSASCKVSVYKAPSSIKFSSKTAAVSVDQSEKLSYTVTKNSYAVLTWESSNPDVVRVAEDGTITGVSAGTAAVRVKTQNGKSATISVTVYAKPTRVDVSCPVTELGAGQKVELKAGTDSANPHAVTGFVSSDAGVARVTESGVVEAVAAGQVTITAQAYNGVSGSVTLTVHPVPESVALPSENLVMGVQQTGSLAAILPEGTMAGLTYASSNKKVVSVDVAGNIKALRTGTATIKVTTHNGKSASCKVSVYKAPSSIKFSSKTAAVSVDQSEKLSYTVTKNSYAVLTWESSNPDVVRVAEDGTITGVSAGTAAVRVKTQNGKSATISVTVYAKPTYLALKVDLAMLGVGQKLNPGIDIDTTNLSAVAYTSSDPGVAKVAADGTITAVGPGVATITARSYNGLQDTAEITVKAAPSSVRIAPTSITMGVGEVYALSPVITEGSYTQFTYKASNSRVSVTEGGLITARKSGTAKVTVTTHNGKKATLSIKVLNAPSEIRLDKTELTLELGQTAQLKYALTKNTASSVTWYSNNETVCTVNALGVLTPVGRGTATITATTANGKQASCVVRCIEPISDLTLTNSVISVQVGDVESLGVKATTASGGDYEGEIAYTSSDASIAKADSGNVYGKKAGNCQVKVEAGGKSVVLTVTVVAATSDSKANTVVHAALEKQGSKYVYATHGPNTFDCSGLVYYAFRQIGITLPASAHKQGYSSGTQITYDQLRPGDIVCFNTSDDGDDDLVDHTGIYIGSGQFVHASSAAGKVIVSRMDKDYYHTAFVWGRRIL